MYTVLKGEQVWCQCDSVRAARWYFCRGWTVVPTSPPRGPDDEAWGALWLALRVPAVRRACLTLTSD